jgi:hypothetical protein
MTSLRDLITETGRGLNKNKVIIFLRKKERKGKDSIQENEEEEEGGGKASFVLTYRREKVEV